MKERIDSAVLADAAKKISFRLISLVAAANIRRIPSYSLQKHTCRYYVE
jgi:hypothetical protein